MKDDVIDIVESVIDEMDDRSSVSVDSDGNTIWFTGNDKKEISATVKEVRNRLNAKGIDLKHNSELDDDLEIAFDIIDMGYCEEEIDEEESLQEKKIKYGKRLQKIVESYETEYQPPVVFTIDDVYDSSMEIYLKTYIPNFIKLSSIKSRDPDSKCYQLETSDNTVVIVLENGATGVDVGLNNYHAYDSIQRLLRLGSAHTEETIAELVSKNLSHVSRYFSDEGDYKRKIDSILSNINLDGFEINDERNLIWFKNIDTFKVIREILKDSGYRLVYNDNYSKEGKAPTYDIKRG